MVALASALLVLLCNVLVVAAPGELTSAHRKLQTTIGEVCSTTGCAATASCTPEITCTGSTCMPSDGTSCCVEEDTPTSVTDCGPHSTGLVRANVSHHVCRCVCEVGYSGGRCELEEQFCAGLHRSIGATCSTIAVLGLFGWGIGMLVLGVYPLLVWFEARTQFVVQELARTAYERKDGLVTERAWHETTETGSIPQRLVSRIENGSIHEPADDEESNRTVSFEYTCVRYTASIEFDDGEKCFSLPSCEMARTTGADHELYALRDFERFPLGLGGGLHTDLDP